MKLFLAQTGRCWKAALPLLAGTLLIAGCIPSAPETPPVPAPAPTDTQAAPAAADPAAKPSAPVPTHEGQPTASLRFDPAGKSNASVTVESMKEGTGLNIRGTFNLTGTIVPNGPGKWKFSGQFSVAEPDFSVGTLLASAMGTFRTTTESASGISTDASLVLIDIPVSPPAAKAPEGTALRSIPISLDIDAPPNAQFTVTLTQKQVR